MDRRELLLGSISVAAAAITGRALAADKMPDHAQHEHAAAPVAGEHAHHHAGPTHPKLLQSAATCVSSGQICIRHCLDLFAQGNNKELAACSISVNELVSVCGTLQQLAASNSKYLPRYAKFAMDVCKGCEEECRKHEKKHQACKDCAEACASCAKECEKVAA
jgi:Cys-rich four helix bundle protein (predicted Tat secretion target)